MEFRERPYSQFNFLVQIGEDADPHAVQAGFQEASGIGTEVNTSDYRNGNEARNGPRKIHSTFSVSDVTLSRGVIGAADLTDWLRQVRDGKQGEALKDVTIKLLSEDRSTTAVTWILRNARPTGYSGPSLTGTGTDVAVEELTLACEDIEIE